MSNAELLALLNSKDDEGMGWNNPFFYLIFIWLFAMFGGNGFGFGGNGGAAASALTQEISNDFLYSNLNSGIESVRNGIINTQNGIASATYDLAGQICNLNQSIGASVADVASRVDRNRYDMALEMQQLSRQMSECCCTTNRNIDALANQVTMESCAIKEAIYRDGEATRALINANTVQNLRDELQATQMALSNNTQTAAISEAIDAKLANIVGYPSRAPLWAMPPFMCPTSTSTTSLL